MASVKPIALAAVGVWLLCAVPARGAAAEHELLAGASRRPITPEGRVWLAGHGLGPFRGSRGVAHELHVRALALTQGERTLVLVSADLVGLFREEVRAIESLLAARLPDGGARMPAIILTATHTHSGPDALGFWGGWPRAERDRFRGQVLAAIEGALASRRPAELSRAAFRVPSRTSSRRDLAGNEEQYAVALRLLDQEGGVLATLVNFAAHPTLFGRDSRLIGPDFPGYLSARIEANSGGVALYFTGAAGDIAPLSPQGRGIEAARSYGEALADLVEAALSLGGTDPGVPVLDFRRRELGLPITNWPLILASELGLAGRRFAGGRIETEVWAVRIGEAYLLTFPGEPLAGIGRHLRQELDVAATVVIGLANDAIGYLVPRDEWRPRGYEERLALSPVAGDLVADAVLTLAAELAGRSSPEPRTDAIALAQAMRAARRLQLAVRLAIMATLLAILLSIAVLVATAGSVRRTAIGKDRW
jgi:hypothetical protein